MNRLLCLGCALLPLVGTAQILDESKLATVEYRNLGPYRVGAWVSDFAVPENGREHLYTFYVAMRSGGVWKTENNGTTFVPVFDGNGVQAIGDVTVAPSDNDIVWVGTGDNANARSSHPGIGVFKSADGGESWRHMGLADTQHIARIAIHPNDSDTVFVAAIGHLFSKNEERGLFKSTDGGESWSKVLYINDGVGVVDVIINRDDPQLVYAATYQMERYPWHFEAGGPESAIYRSTDGGDNWERLGGGLPSGDIGRIGIDLYRADPNVVYAVYENLNERPPTADETSKDIEDGKEPQPRAIGGEVYRSDDAGRSWTKTHDAATNVGGKAPYSFNQIFVDPNDDQNVFVTSVYLPYSQDGGKTWKNLENDQLELFKNNFGDVRTFWIDPDDSDRMLFGSDGGVYLSYDGGVTSDHLYNLPTGEFYAIGVDMADPYNIYGGLQDHESWKGPINSWSGAVSLDDWVLVGLWDGMYNQVDPTDNRYLYTTGQFGGHRRVDQVNGSRNDIEPRNPDDDSKRRYPWTPAIQISPHDHNVVYAGSQRLMRSDDRGDSWIDASPDLTQGTLAADGGRCANAGGAQGWINFCTITTLDESELVRGLIWAGTDDGRVHVTDNGGSDWREVTADLVRAGADEDHWVSRVRASLHSPGTAFVTKNGFRFDDFSPQVYKTTDYGRNWRSIASNLPASAVNVIVEDRQNPDLLYVGNDRGVYVSIDGAVNWTSLQANMPVVPVKDLLVHPRELDLIAATYGRGLYVTDVSMFREMNEHTFAQDIHLFHVEDNVIRRSERADWGSYHMRGDRHLFTENEAAGFAINYHLRESPTEDIEIRIFDERNSEVAMLTGTANPGMNKVHWDSSAIEDLTPGKFRIELSSGDSQISTSANLKPPRAFAIGPQSGPLENPR